MSSLTIDEVEALTPPGSLDEKLLEIAASLEDMANSVRLISAVHYHEGGVCQCHACGTMLEAAERSGSAAQILRRWARDRIPYHGCPISRTQET